MKSLSLTIAALVLSTGLAGAACPTGLSGGATYVVDLRGVLTLTACDQTWLRAAESGRRVRITVGTDADRAGASRQADSAASAREPSSTR
jgi:hypothetical protein